MMLNTIDQQIKELDDDLDQAIKDTPAWQEKVDLLKAVPGVGDQTARCLVAQLPELGSCSRQQIARLVGVAPINRDSGTMRGKRTTGGGRAAVRCALYMATLVATQHNPKIKTYYQRLVASGKKKMVALVAAMRKLLVILNAMLRNQTTWRTIYHEHLTFKTVRYKSYSLAGKMLAPLKSSARCWAYFFSRLASKPWHPTHRQNKFAHVAQS